MARRIDPGVRVVAGVCLLLTAVSGFGFYSLTVYLHALTASGAFRLTAVSQATALYFAAAGLAGVLTASLLARFDARTVIAGGAVLMATGLLLIGRVHSAPQLYADYLLLGSGQAAAGTVPGTTLVARWFVLRRRSAMAIATTGLSIGGIAVAPVIAALASRHPLRSLTPWVALAFLIVALIATATLRPDPAAVGLAPDGGRAAVADQPAPAEGMLLRQASRTRAFWGISLTQALAVLAQVGGLTHLFALGAERTSTTIGGAAVSLAALGSFTGRFLGTAALRRIELHTFGRILLLVQAGALALLAVTHGSALLLAGALLFGLTVGNVLLVQPLLIGEAFGLRDYARVLARSALISTLGLTAGPYLVGELHADAGGYTAGYLAIAASSVLGALLLSGTARHLPRPDTDPLPTADPAALPAL